MTVFADKPGNPPNQDNEDVFENWNNAVTPGQTVS
jgi:hypothetical protein